MDRVKYLIVVILFFILVFLFMRVVIPDAEKSKNKYIKLDSLQTYFSELDILKKTITIAYSGISEEEAKYYAYIFYTTSKKYKNVDPCSYAALIRIESGWNSTLVSSKRCRGLTQISVAASIEECKKFGIDYKEGITEWNSITNLIIGLNYFSCRYEKKGLDYAMRSYIGGDNFSVAGASNQETINKYTKDFLNEYNKVNYIHKGVQYESFLKGKPK